LNQSSRTSEQEATINSGNKVTQHRHSTESGNREIAATNRHPTVNVKDLRRSRQENSNTGYLTDAQHLCQPQEQLSSDYTVATKKDATVNKTAISAVDDNDRPAEPMNYYGQCRDSHIPFKWIRR